MERLSGFYNQTVSFEEKYKDSTLELYQEVFGYKEYSPYIRQLMEGDTSSWDWRYRDGVSVRLVALQEGGEVVGHLGAIIRDVQVGDHYVKGAEIIEGVVKSSLRGGITLYKLIQEMRRQLIGVNGTDFAVLFPNSFSAGTVLKRATAQREAFLWERHLGAEMRGGFVELGGEEFVNLAQPLFYQRLITNPGTVRTSEYLRWRYLENPSGNYRFIASKAGDAVVVVKKYDETKGHIVDVVSSGRESFIEVISGGQRALVQMGAMSVSLYPLIFPEEQWLQEMGFRRNNWGRRLVMFTAGDFFPAQELVDNWYLTMGEHSIF